MLSASLTPPTVYEQPHRGFGRHESCPHSQLLFNWPPTPIRLCEAIKSLTNSSLHSLVRKTPLPRVLAITLPSNSNLIATACRVFNGSFKHIFERDWRKDNTVKILLGVIRWLKSPSKYEFDDEIEYLFGKKQRKPEWRSVTFNLAVKSISLRKKSICRLAS